MADAAAEPLGMRYWKAVAELGGDRRAGLDGLESCFREGRPVQRPEGRHAGRLLATTFGFGLDGVFETLARVWMPWKGKAFDAEEKSGRNVFTSGFRVPMRLMWPGHHDEEPAGPGRFTTFRFSTWTGPSAIDPSVEVLKVNYAIPESPAFLISSILDEVVEIEEGLSLGQALMRGGEGFRRVAWFSLASPGRSAR